MAGRPWGEPTDSAAYPESSEKIRRQLEISCALLVTEEERVAAMVAAGLVGEKVVGSVEGLEAGSAAAGSAEGLEAGSVVGWGVGSAVEGLGEGKVVGAAEGLVAGRAGRVGLRQARCRLPLPRDPLRNPGAAVPVWSLCGPQGRKWSPESASPLLDGRPARLPKR